MVKLSFDTPSTRRTELHGVRPVRSVVPQQQCHNLVDRGLVAVAPGPAAMEPVVPPQMVFIRNISAKDDAGEQWSSKEFLSGENCAPTSFYVDKKFMPCEHHN